MPMLLDDLATPALLIERSRLTSNIGRMQELADREGAELRPHTKTHKSIALARRQIERGASGITVAKVGEAEVFAAAGFEDIRIAYEVVGEDKLVRLAAVAQRCRISSCVDTMEGAAALSRRFAAEESPIEVLVEVDTGHGRCGIPWDDEDAVDFVRFVADQLP